jgi:hypothetical protein
MLPQTNPFLSLFLFLEEEKGRGKMRLGSWISPWLPDYNLPLVCLDDE